MILLPFKYDPQVLLTTLRASLFLAITYLDIEEGSKGVFIYINVASNLHSII